MRTAATVILGAQWDFGGNRLEHHPAPKQLSVCSMGWRTTDIHALWEKALQELIKSSLGEGVTAMVLNRIRREESCESI